MAHDPTADKSTLVQLMAWFRPATSMAFVDPDLGLQKAAKG